MENMIREPAEQAFQQLYKQTIDAHEAAAAGEILPGPLGIVQLDHNRPLNGESPELLAEVVRILNHQIDTMAGQLNDGSITEALAFHRGKLLETVGAYIEARMELAGLSAGTTASEPEFFDVSNLNPHAAEPEDLQPETFPDTSHSTNGQRFGRLTVLGKIAAVSSRSVVLCRCDCGTYHLARTQDLTAGKVQSCGCYHEERNVAAHTIHGGSSSRLYTTWAAMRARCTNPDHDNFTRYGGRGVTVCPEWESFEIFRDWALANGYRDDLTIDRIDNDGPYSPSNCRWATRAEQQNNTRRNIHVTYMGQTMTLMEAARASGIAYNTLRRRYHANGELGLFIPAQQLKQKATPRPLRAEDR